MTAAHPGLARRALSYLILGFFLLAALFFGTAGTLDYWEAWLYLVILFTPVLLAMVYLLRRDPDLLERRLRSRERRDRQTLIVTLVALVMALAFVSPGLDQRFGWSNVPPAVVIGADVVVLLGYALFFRVLRENSYAGRTVAVDAGQLVVTTGPYRVVRHPMYVAVLVMYIASPLALGSYWAVLPALLLPIFIVARIRDEERMLAESLPGYGEFQAQTRNRLIPGIW
jgi:protein-S-isoprenylcysteine O-methyltransferase Ste14